LQSVTRRYLAYDINPSRDDIDKHDITKGLPEKARNIKLAFLDPPYWGQKRGSYSSDETNLANVSLDKFYYYLEQTLNHIYNALLPTGYISLIIGPTHDQGRVVDHAIDLYKILEKNYMFVNRIIVPYTTQQTQPYHVADAKENKYMLKIYRDLLIFQKKEKQPPKN
jgi:DNA modification methylase